MSQKMPLLSRVLGTAAFASVIVVLLMSYQWGLRNPISNDTSDPASPEMISPPPLTEASTSGMVFASAELVDVAARLAATQRPFAARCLTDRAPEAVDGRRFSPGTS